MKKHLFITGTEGCGKTALLRQELGGALAYAGGFITECVPANGGATKTYVLRPAAAPATGDSESYSFMDCGSTPPVKDNEVFRGPAVRLIEEARNYPFAMLDEFGGFEMVIPQFRNALAELLNSETPIIGVLVSEDRIRELTRSFGLGDRFTMLTANLKTVLGRDSDTVLLEMRSGDDMAVRRIVRQWVSEYALF